LPSVSPTPLSRRRADLRLRSITLILNCAHQVPGPLSRLPTARQHTHLRRYVVLLSKNLLLFSTLVTFQIAPTTLSRWT